MYCLQARSCIIQPWNFTGWGCEGVNRLLRCGELSRWNNYGTGAKRNIISHNVFKTLSGKKITKSTVKLAYITPHQDRRHNKPHTCMQEYNTQSPIILYGNGQYSNSKYQSVPEARTC